MTVGEGSMKAFVNVLKDTENGFYKDIDLVRSIDDTAMVIES